MEQSSNDDWCAALLTAGSFLAMISAWLLAALDALAGSAWCQPEFALGFACALAFATLLALREPLSEPAILESVQENVRD